MTPRNCISLGLTAVLMLSNCIASAATLFAINHTARTLYTIDTTNVGSPTLVGYIGPYSDLSALVAVSPDRLYTTDRATNVLLTLDSSTAQVIASVTIDRSIGTHPRGYALSPAGVLYGVIGTGIGTTPQLYTLDPLTGTTTLVASISGATLVEGLAFAPDGTLYAVGSPTDDVWSNTLYRLSPTTGALTLVGTLPSVSDVDDIAFGADGFIYGADSVAGLQADLYRINPLTAAVQNLGNSGVLELNGLSAAPVPIPAAFWLFGGALGILTFVRREQAAHREVMP